MSVFSLRIVCSYNEELSVAMCDARIFSQKRTSDEVLKNSTQAKYERTQKTSEKTEMRRCAMCAGVQCGW